jgi:hypothetical protein
MGQCTQSPERKTVNHKFNILQNYPFKNESKIKIVLDKYSWENIMLAHPKLQERLKEFLQPKRKGHWTVTWTYIKNWKALIKVTTPVNTNSNINIFYVSDSFFSPSDLKTYCIKQ